MASSASLSCGETHCCTVQMDGTASCWGSNGLRELGGDTVCSPVLVEAW